jgi:hypothetical protein
MVDNCVLIDLFEFYHGSGLSTLDSIKKQAADPVPIMKKVNRVKLM